jgi:prolyl-tRNA editing enzyme YbaK/EbsC (Cys-tRNA(Pro) deacylase)
MEAIELGAEGLRAWIERHEVAARIVVPGVPTPTVPSAAAALGVASRDILKSLVFIVDGAPRLVVAAGEDRLPYPALARAFDVSRRRIRLADADETLRITGYVVGAMPPFGHRAAIETLVDASCVAVPRIVYGGGGARDALLELHTDVLLSATGARVAELGVTSEGRHEERNAP